MLKLYILYMAQLACLHLHSVTHCLSPEERLAVEEQFVVDASMEEVEKVRFEGEDFVVGKQLHAKWLSSVANAGKLAVDLAVPLLFFQPKVP